MVIEMLREDIEASNEYVLGFVSFSLCPISMALKRCGYKDVFVDAVCIEIDGKRYTTDKSVSDWQSDLLVIHNINPITLEFIESTDNGLGYVTIS